MSKKTAAFFVLGAGALVALLIVLVTPDRSDDRGKGGGSVTLTTNGDGAAAANFNFVRDLPNLTDEFTDEALAALMAKNESLKEASGADPADYALLPARPDVAVIVSKLVDDELAAEAVALEDVRVNSSNDPDTQRAYLLFVNHVLEAKGAEMPAFAGVSLPVYFESTAAKLDEIASILLSVNVPPSWREIHRDLAAFFVRERNIYRSLGAAEEDPLRFMIAAMRLLPAEAARELDAIQSRIEQKASDEKLI